MCIRDRAHHVLKAQVVALGRGLGLPDAGRCVPCRAASALGTAALTVAAEAAFPRAVVVGAGAAALMRSAGCRRQQPLDGQRDLAVRCHIDDLHLYGVAVMQHGCNVLHELVRYLGNVRCV